MAQLAILCVDQPTDAERNLFALAHLLGVDGDYLATAGSHFTPEALERRLLEAKAVAVSAAALCTLERHSSFFRVLRNLAGNPLAGFLIYGYEPNGDHAALARRLIGPAVSGIDAVRDGRRCSFPGARAHTHQLAGCHFERDASEADCSFRLDGLSGVETLIEVGGGPTLVRTVSGGVPWFHWTAMDAIADPDAIINEDAMSRRCDRFVPPIIFLRATCPESCWHNPLKTARVIVDDPLLTPKYGFLRYGDLFRSLTRLRYGVTTAFIPWNYKRTTPSAAALFAEHEPAHCICIHGCDHTNNEFGVKDDDILSQKAVLALKRMEEHQRRTGITHDRVMVFPQGEFSAAAMRALRRAGFLAVVNSTRMPSDSSEGGVTLGEELLPATDRFSGLPIFTRRYPRHLSAFALDLFLGKPALIVEHHRWFAGGCGEVERCVEFLTTVEPSLAWPRLSDSLRRQHLRRQGGDGSHLIRFFTSIFEFESCEAETRSFVFSKAEPEPALVRSVAVDGERVEFGYDNGLLVFQRQLQPAQRILVQVSPTSHAVSRTWVPSLKYRAEVHLRRALSEFRDNHLAKHPMLATAAQHVVRTLKWSSDSRVGR